MLHACFSANLFPWYLKKYAHKSIYSCSPKFYARFPVPRSRLQTFHILKFTGNIFFSSQDQEVSSDSMAIKLFIRTTDCYSECWHNGICTHTPLAGRDYHHCKCLLGNIMA